MFASFFGGIKATFASAFAWCSEDENQEAHFVTERHSAQVLQRFSVKFIENYKLVSNNNQTVPRIKCLT